MNAIIESLRKIFVPLWSVPCHSTFQRRCDTLETCSACIATRHLAGSGLQDTAWPVPLPDRVRIGLRFFSPPGTRRGGFFSSARESWVRRSLVHKAPHISFLGVAQSGRVLDLESRGRRFESFHPDQTKDRTMNSNQTTVGGTGIATVAQMAERLPRKELVAGSSPRRWPH